MFIIFRRDKTTLWTFLKEVSSTVRIILLVSNDVIMGDNSLVEAVEL